MSICLNYFQIFSEFLYQNWKLIVTPISFSAIFSIGLTYWKEKKIHIHKIQFEKEFQVYEELWSKLIELKKSIEITEFWFQTGEDEWKYEKQRNSLCTKKYYEVLDIVQQYQPFLHSKIYKGVKDLLAAFAVEDEDTIQAPENPNDFENRFNYIVDAIKKRIN